MALLLFSAIACACVIGFATSFVMNWASGKSAVWSMGFAVAVVLALAAVVLLGVVLAMRRF